MQSLETVIDLLCQARGIHISVLDLAGVLHTPLTELRFENTIHATSFCAVAKSTAKGYRACLRCKAMAGRRAVEQKTPFAGHCLWGLAEASVPVSMAGSVVAVVYVGHGITDMAVTCRRIDKMCSFTGVKKEALLATLDDCERVKDMAALVAPGEVVANYLAMLCREAKSGSPREHWMVSVLKRHADAEYTTQLTLKDLATEYRQNEKYLGRLFLKATGVTFHQYCLSLRLDAAARLLREGNDRVIDIALACGFDTVSYLNRVFLKKYNMTPTAYRRAAK